MAIWRWKLHWQILLGMVAGAFVGVFIGAWAIGQLSQPFDPSEAGARAARIATGSAAYMIFDLIGDLFLNGLRLIIVPLVTSSIVLAVIGIGRAEGLGRLGLRTLTYYLCTSLLAIMLGLTLVDLVRPGVGSDGLGILQGKDLTAFAEDQATIEQKVGGRGGSDFLDVFRQMVPPNVVAAAAEGQLLGLIVVSLISGYVLVRLPGEHTKAMIDLVQTVYDLTLKVTDIVLALAPIGVMALIATTIGEQVARLWPDSRLIEFVWGIVSFAAVVLAALAIHMGVMLPAILLLLGRVNPLRHYQAMAPALLTAFSTASSSATLPVTMECVEQRAGVPNKTAGFVLPLGATVNMDGTALYECVAAVFICQAFGVHLSFGQQFLIVMVALLTSIGVAGVPAASLVAIMVILQGVQKQLPADAPALIAGFGLLFVFDRPLDMCRTAVNIFSDSCGAVVVGKGMDDR
ncbi:MAG: dicarboxylate/amino acid:cation symporter [Phycisphaeraceae bacterium]|nr:dicarboxylate/amino acid:cation symporter [Phycisphaeraceae bacterium]